MDGRYVIMDLDKQNGDASPDSKKKDDLQGSRGTERLRQREKEVCQLLDETVWARES